MFKLKAGDEVLVVGGKDKGKRGKIEKILLKENKIVVGGVNVYKRYRKVSRKQPAGLFEAERPLAIANVVLICPKCGKGTRVGFALDAKDKKRICKKCKGVIG